MTSISGTRGRNRGRRRPVVGVLGSGERADPYAAEIGRLVATLGCHLLTGGGAGVMEAASRAFAETPDRKGTIIGVVPGFVEALPNLEARAPGVTSTYDVDPRYPNEWVEIAIFTHLPDSGRRGTLRSSRNHINVLSSDALVALGGGPGTYSEMWLALRYGVPLIAYGPHESIPEGADVTSDLNEVERFLRRQMGPLP
jgi:predicted Rossmann-fold nucleotide-binding protein